jgi:MFS family permease
VRRWIAVIELSLDQLVAWGALYYAYSVLSVPMAESLGLARELVAAGFSVALLVSGLLARPTGRFLDVRGARPVLLAGAVLGPLALGALAVARGPLGLFAAFALLGVAHALALYEPAIRAVVDWFPRQAERARALLVLTVLGGFASTAFLPLTAWLLERVGWRTSLAALALTVALVCGGVALRMPSSRGVGAPIGSESGAEPGAGRRALRLLALAFALQSFASTGLLVALVWFLSERGIELGQAAAIAGLAGAAQVPGRLLLGPLQRRVATRTRLPLLLGVQAVAVLGIASGAPWLLHAAIVIFGMAAGTMTLERAAVLIEWFGLRGFGARGGSIAAASAIARASSPYAIELLRGAVGYKTAFRALAVVMLVAAATTIAAGRSVDGASRSRCRA